MQSKAELLRGNTEEIKKQINKMLEDGCIIEKIFPMTEKAVYLVIFKMED